MVVWGLEYYALVFGEFQDGVGLFGVMGEVWRGWAGGELLRVGFCRKEMAGEDYCSYSYEDAGAVFEKIYPFAGTARDRPLGDLYEYPYRQHREDRWTELVPAGHDSAYYTPRGEGDGVVGHAAVTDPVRHVARKEGVGNAHQTDDDPEDPQETTLFGGHSEGVW